MKKYDVRPTHGRLTKAALRRIPTVEPLEDRLAPAAAFAELIDPNPSFGNLFGTLVVPLSTGNVVVTAPADDAGGTNAGAVYLFNGATGALISTVRGSTPDDRVGDGGIITLPTGNFLIRSTNWQNGTADSAGAVTFGNGVTGVSGAVSAANSLIGTVESDRVGNGVTIVLPNGNYLVRSPLADGRGAVTFGNGLTGVVGPVTTTNSLMGSTAADGVGSNGIAVLSNGNYVIRSDNWDNGTATNAGAVTWGNGTTGVVGLVSATNSLVGITSNDQVGRDGIFDLPSGNYLVRSSFWDNGSATNAGAVTFGNGLTGVVGSVTSANSLVGTSMSDQVGNRAVTVLSNGNYVVGSTLWNNGTALQAGAVTWGSGTTGVVGPVSAANSLVGPSLNDRVGTQVIPLTNGNYVVYNTQWNIPGGTLNVGAVTWGDGSTGIVGPVSASNSLIGSTPADMSAASVVALTNGHYVVATPNWDNGGLNDVGAVTWCNGMGGRVGPISTANSLVGSTLGDNLGQIGGGGIFALPNGNYVVRSVSWDNGTTPNVGAITLGNGATGTVGTVSATNSLIGGTENDFIGSVGVIVLPNSNYLVSSRLWDHGSAADAGALTFCNGTTGTVGLVSASNSLVGSQANDQVSSSSPIILTNGNYVAASPNWDNGSIVDAGAVTLGSGTTGVHGVISSANSLVGSTESDKVGFNGLVPLTNGNYVVISALWNSGANTDVGAVTWGNGTTGTVGPVGPTNSLVGTVTNDQVGGGFGVRSITALPNGNYVVVSPFWSNSGLISAGAVTFGDGTKGVSGVVSSANSAIGQSPNSNLQQIVVDPVNNTFFGRFPGDDSGRVRVGSQIDGFAVGPKVISFKVLYGNGQSYELIGSTRFTVPWQITGIQAVFSTAVTGTINSLSGFSLSNFSGNGTNTLTWTLTTPLALANLSAQFLSSGVDAIRSTEGTTLDGNGDGTSGDMFTQSVKVLFGDVNGDGIVNSTDIAILLARTRGQTVPVADPFLDVNGDGIVDIADFNLARSRSGSSLS